MRQGMGHMLNREVSKGWRAWTGMLSARAEFLQLLGRGVRGGIEVDRDGFR